MASGGRFVTFAGQTKFDPGGITKINSKALSPIGLSAQGVVALIGEADKGAPGLSTIDDPALAKELYGSGPLADAIRVAFDPSNDPRIPGGAQRVLAYKVNASTQGSTSLYGDESVVSDTAAAGSTSTVVNLTTGGLTVSANVGQWMSWDGGTIGVKQWRRITANTASAVTVSPAYSGVPVATDVMLILENQLDITSRAYGVDGNLVSIEFEDGVGTNKKVATISDGTLTETSPEILGDPAMYLKYVGGPVFVTGGTVTSVDSTGLVVTTTLTAAGLDDAAGLILRFADGTQREVVTNTLGATAKYTLAAGQALSSSLQASLAGLGVEVINVTAASGTLTGAAGAATTLTTTVTPTADDLSLTFTNNETLNAFATRVNATTNYEVVVPDGVNGDVVLMKDFDFGTASTSVDIRFDSEQDPGNKGHLRRDLYELVSWINSFSTLASATRSATGQEGSEIPVDTTGKVYLTDAVRGTSTNTLWQAAFDTMALNRCNHIVPLIAHDLVDDGYSSSATLASVAAQLKSHVQLMRGSGQSERGGYIGMSGTRTEVEAQANAMNDPDVQLYAQKFTTLNVDSNLVEMDEWVTAVSAAGMRAGAEEVGEPLTFKRCKTTALSQDSSWDPKDTTDRNALIEAGVMFAEESPSAGFRWVRDLTTYVSEDNIALIDAHVRDAVRFVAYDLRTSLEDRFTGEKALPATVASMKGHISSKAAEYLDDNILVYSDDPENPTGVAFIPGYRRLRVSIVGNTASIKMEIFPVTGIVFQLTDIFLQLPIVV